MELYDLKGKKALVTGGTKGIGNAIANELAAAGATVIISARTAPENTPHHFIAADLTNAAQVAALAQQITESFGGIDILINNVGGLTTPGGGHGSLTDAHWEQELDLNLISAIRLDRALLPQMIEQNSGVVIHISSVAGKQALWNLNMAYAVSKAALNSYSKALSTELAEKGIRVLTVAPGATKTEPMVKFLNDFSASAGITPEEGMKQLMAQTGGIPMGRMAEPEEVAQLVHFLVSPSAAYLTGTIYAIDGGSLPVVS
ncbi:SDR family oxidoreductase [Mucilaginibacter aquatilis]|uniref:SDR family oxidoreductase n=1 Tax=Mucilaginibacter aquatilis TaxID=1517760 RepID=A0A6I4IQL5_9SPHI|nr:SDR family oxidoreductase [Mucilaginibacter aquatilis]MVN91364.1 SDR family oxidoreductase [Mucilaginibacter aquatilis]